MSSPSLDKETVVEENEEHGPKKGIKISLDQADIIIQRHFPSRRAIRISHINRGYNNRVYIVTTINSDIESEGEEEFIIRLTGRFWTRYKTENELCALFYLARHWPSLRIPKVFGYCTDREKSGVNAEYILMEKLKGDVLEHVWNKLEPKNKMVIVDQLAEMFAPMLNMTFDEIGSFHFASDSIGNSFGIGVDPQRDIVDGEDDILRIGKGVEFDGGPYTTFLEFFTNSCETELNFLRKHKFMHEAEGYEERLTRIEKFVDAFKSMETVPAGFDKDALENVPFVFCHGDLEPRNILVDEDSLEITGLVDFEWAGAYPVDDEWFSGFSFVDADTSEWRVFNEERSVDEEDESDREKQEVADSVREHFLNAMRKNGILVPDDIAGHNARAELYYFKGFISPWWLREKRNPIPETHYHERSNACKRVDAILDKYGF